MNLSSSHGPSLCFWLNKEKKVGICSVEGWNWLMAPFLFLLFLSDMVIVQSSDPSIIVVASGVCALILELTSEEFLLSHCDFDISALESLSYLFVASLDQVLPISLLL